MLSHSNDLPKTPGRVVILGSAGVVGKKLVPYLQKKDIATVTIARDECDLLSTEAVDYLAQTFQKDDQIVFLTAITPDKGRGIDAFTKNIKILDHVSQALQKSPAKQFILFSSEAIYPITSELINEETSLAPSDLYGCMHLSREIHLRSLSTPLAIVRSTLIYGEGDTHNSYGPNRFLKEALTQGTITIFGGGEEKRSHIFVEDVVVFIENLLLYQSTGNINLCPGSSVSFMEVAKTIKNVLQDKIEIITKPRASEITHRYFDNTKLYQAFPNLLYTDIKTGVSKILLENKSNG